MTDDIDEPETFDLSAMSRSELEAEIVSQANIIERFRTRLSAAILGLEDEGDRVYFGSSNDADELRQIEQEMLASGFELAMPWMHGHDLNADLSGLRMEVGRLTGQLRHAQAVLATIPDPEAYIAAARGMRGVAERLVQLCIDGGLTHDLVAQLYPDSKKPNGQPAFEFAKRAQREINEAKAHLASFDAAQGEQ